MFDYSLVHWTTFLGAALLLNLSPGPDIAFILGQTVRRGRRAGFAAMGGVWAGTLVHVFFASVGLAAILVASATAFTVVKWAGAAYLVYLGVMAWRSSGRLVLSDQVEAPLSGLKLMQQGIGVSLLNPKVAIFFLAFLPQFVVDGAGPQWAQLALHGLLVIAVAAVVEPPLVVLGSRLTQTWRDQPRLGQWLDRCLGSVFVSLGIRLALQEPGV
jgi:threonine/homoserine/homoserine lactone efflux protein